MGKLVIHHERITPQNASELVALCPFGAISYETGTLDISSGCKMCKMCVQRGRDSSPLPKTKRKWINPFGRAFASMPIAPEEHCIG